MINTALRTSAILVALVALSSCGSTKPPTAPSNPTVSLFGTVTAEGGVKLSGATVRIGDGVNAGQSTTTNESGEYRFDGLVASNGNVSAIAGGYDSVITGIYIDGRQPLNFTLRTSVPWSKAGIGGAMFDMPTYIKRVQIIGTYTGVSGVPPADVLSSTRPSVRACLLTSMGLLTPLAPGMKLPTLYRRVPWYSL
jgi:hypothetical protein